MLMRLAYQYMGIRDVNAVDGEFPPPNDFRCRVLVIKEPSLFLLGFTHSVERY